MSEGATGAAQNTANELVDGAQKLGNEVVDLGEEAAGVVLGAVIEAQKQLLKVSEKLKATLVGEQ